MVVRKLVASALTNTCTATLKLAVVPEEYSVAVVTFPSIRDAAAAAASVMQTGIPVAAMEIMDEVQMKVVNLSGATAPKVWKELPTLFFKFSGTKEGVRDNIKRVREITTGNKGGDFVFARDEREQHLLWSARKESLWSMLSLRKTGQDVCESRFHSPSPRWESSGMLLKANSFNREYRCSSPL